MKPEAQIIMKLQDLDGWKYFGRNMLWLGVIGGGLMVAHALTLAYVKLRYRGKDDEARRNGYGALALPRFEIMIVVLAMPCISQAAAAVMRGGTTGGLAVGIVLSGILMCLLVGLLLFLWLGIAMGRLVQYKELEEEGQEYWCQELIRLTLGPGKRWQWTWKQQGEEGEGDNQLGPLFEDLRGPPTKEEEEGGKAWAPPVMEKVLGVVRIHYTFLEWVKRVAMGIVVGTHSSSSLKPLALLLSLASFQLLFLLLMKPFIKRRVQLVETVSVASEVFLLLLIILNKSEGVAMLGVFLVGFAAQACNQWIALFRQVRLLSSSNNSFLEGAKTTLAGLMLLLLPSSSSLLLLLAGDRHGPPGAGGRRVSSSSSHRWWLRQLRDMAKASFTNN